MNDASPPSAHVPTKKGLNAIPTVVLVWLGFLAFWIAVEALSRVFPASSVGATVVEPSQLMSYVTDNGGILKPGDEARLLTQLSDFQKRTSNQIALAIYPRLPTSSVEEFTIQVAEKSRFDGKGLDNGAILFIFLAERVARLEVGYGLEGAIPDAAAVHILREKLAPQFAQGAYIEGLDATLDAVMAAVPADYQKARGGRLIPISWSQVIGAAKVIGRELWPVLRDSDAKIRIVASFFGSLIGMGIWTGFANSGRLAIALYGAARNSIRGRRFGSAIKKVEFSSIFDTVKVVLFLLGLFVALAVTVMAGSGSFGGGGALIRW